MRIPGKITDSTTGTASETCDDATASVKDDMATIASKINQLVDAVRSLDTRLAALEGQD